MTRLMFAMTPFYAREPAAARRPPGGDGRLARGGLAGLGPRPPDPRARAPPDVARAPGWVRDSPWLRPFARFWGEGLTQGPPLAVDEAIFDWARTDPEGLRAAARAIADGEPIEPGSGAARLMAYLDRPLVPRPDGLARLAVRQLLRNRPEALAEAVEILIARPDAVRSVLLRPAYTDEASIGGFLDRDVSGEPDEPSGRARVLRDEPRVRPPEPVGRGDQPDAGRGPGDDPVRPEPVRPLARAAPAAGRRWSRTPPTSGRSTRPATARRPTARPRWRGRPRSTPGRWPRSTTRPTGSATRGRPPSSATRPPVPLVAARRAGIPGFLLANFTWADIYAPHARKLGADARRIVREIRAAYRQATPCSGPSPA